MSHSNRTHDGYLVPSPSELREARRALSRFVREKARETEERLGFGFYGCPDAPSTYQQLRGAYADSLTTKTALPIFDRFCETSIYERPNDNMCLRYWHDCSHIQLGLSFSLDDELELANWHGLELTRAGFDPAGLAWRLFRADLVGQIYLMGMIGRFPRNQFRFASGCLIYGFDVGIQDEIRFISDGPDGSRSARHRPKGSAGPVGDRAPLGKGAS